MTRLPPPHWTQGWNIAQPDVVLPMPTPVTIPKDGDVEYTYEIVPTHFTEDKWIQMAEVHPSSPQYVHHAVVYIRPPDSKWLRHAPVGVPFTASTLSDPQDRLEAHGTTSDLLLVYAPGSSPDHWPDGMAKFVPAGSDLVFQVHYTTNGTAGSDRDQRRIGVCEDGSRGSAFSPCNSTITPSSFPPARITFGWKCRARCRTTPRCSACFRICICGGKLLSTTL